MTTEPPGSENTLLEDHGFYEGPGFAIGIWEIGNADNVVVENVTVKGPAEY